MKKLLIIILVFMALAGVTRGQYHIRVECYDNPIAGEQFYHTTYTNNNWITSNEIHNSDEVTNFATMDINDLREYKDVDFTPLLMSNKYILINLARKLKTIVLANKYNDSVLNRYRRLHKYWMGRKPNFKPLPLKIKKTMLHSN